MNILSRIRRPLTVGTRHLTTGYLQCAVRHTASLGRTEFSYLAESPRLTDRDAGLRRSFGMSSPTKVGSAAPGAREVIADQGLGGAVTASDSVAGDHATQVPPDGAPVIPVIAVQLCPSARRLAAATPGHAGRPRSGQSPGAWRRCCGCACLPCSPTRTARPRSQAATGSSAGTSAPLALPG